PRRGAWRKPCVFNHVVDGVAGEAGPREFEMAVGVVREEDGLERVAQARLETASARADVIRALAPERAEAGFDRIGNGDVGFALQITLAGAAPCLSPFFGHVPR